jgi:hypothetical protein
MRKRKYCLHYCHEGLWRLFTSHSRKHCISSLTEPIPAISLDHHSLFLEAEMKKLLSRIILLGILAGIGYLACKKFCNKDNCGCKKEGQTV